MWSRNGRHGRSELETDLRGRRAEASADFVDGVAQAILARSLSPRRAWSRLAFAGAVSVFVLGSFASFGGLSYAASSAEGTVAAVKQIVVKHTLTVSVHTSSAASQYPNTPSKPATPHKPFTPPKVHVAAAKTSPMAVSGKTLPFTGVSLLATFLLSLLLIGAGLALRRRERRS
jgi:hypothetical protein